MREMMYQILLVISISLNYRVFLSSNGVSFIS